MDSGAVLRSLSAPLGLLLTRVRIDDQQTWPVDQQKMRVMALERDGVEYSVTVRCPLRAHVLVGAPIDENAVVD